MVTKKLIQTLVISATLFCFTVGADAAVVVTGTLDGTYPTWNRISDRPDGLGGYVDSANDSMKCWK